MAKFMKGLKILKKISMLIEGTYSSSILSKHVKYSIIIGIDFSTQALKPNGNISKLPTLILSLHKAIYLKATNLSVKVRLFSYLHCMLLFRLLRCPNISVT